METIDIRCPVDPRHLFLKLRLIEETRTEDAGNLIELACYECRKGLKAQGDLSIIRVLHRYDLTGTLVETEIVRA